MADKVEAGDKVTYIPKGGSVANTRTGVARADSKPLRTLAGVYQVAKVTDSKTGEDVEGERVVWKR